MAEVEVVIEEPKDAETARAVELGAWMGRREAYAMIAGRCSAADAESLRRLREEKKYKALGLTWEGFCKQRLGISRATADGTIRHLEEFGPAYFALAQLTGVGPKEYRRIAATVSEGRLLTGGEAIAIAPENAGRLAAVVEQLRAGRAAKPIPAPPEPDEREPAAEPDRDPVRRALENARHGIKLALEEYRRLLALEQESVPEHFLLAELMWAEQEFADLWKGYVYSKPSGE
jgi:hypothetical protein